MAELGEEPHAIPRVVAVLSTILERLAERNDAVHRPLALHHRASAFHGLTKPTISVRSYLERIFRYANCSPSCYVVAYIYLDRFLWRHPTVFLDSFNVHRFLITSVLTAVKFMDDIYYNNAYFAKVGGISLMEMNYLEVDFLFGVGFELNVTPVIFSSYCSTLQREMYLESPASPPRLHCCLTEEESSSCQQKQQLAVSYLVLGEGTI
ncbi:Cyclin [Musa troglodytarum]|uniref:Cyclin n=2 Tax=Musa troglodytarum TaxID=320322 RepID=A0A9E7F839_9LILI|nr:Cyclin [Musa troglodytarum]